VLSHQQQNRDIHVLNQHMNALEEPSFGPEDQSHRPSGWANFKEIPPVLAVRLLLAHE